MVMGFRGRPILLPLACGTWRLGPGRYELASWLQYSGPRRQPPPTIRICECGGFRALHWAVFRVYVRRFHVPVATYFSVVPILILLLAGCVFAAYVNRLRARRRRRPEATWHWRGPDFLALFALRAITAAAFGRILTAPFVFDDYTHIAEASGSAWPRF